MNDLIAITIGDIEGIGIHLLLREFKNKKIKNFILFTNFNIFIEQTNFSKKKINIINKKNINNYHKKKLNIFNFETDNKYTNTLDSLKIAYRLVNKKKFKGILTLPLNKYKINKFTNEKFIDQTSFFSKREKQKYSNMVFFHDKKFFIPLTMHVQLKNVHKIFKNRSYIENKILNIHNTLINDFKISNPKIIISGINPHAGENKIISEDESKYLEPVIKKLNKKNINIIGPVSGDSMINNENLKRFDAFIFTFHDQALIPFKIISNFEGVNFTSNLRVIRASPSHGTAENLIKTNKANSKGIINCFNLINTVYENRQ